MKGRYFILWVEFKLSKIKKINVNYPGIKDLLFKENIKDPTLKQISEIIFKIREEKLPNPAVLANAGSFFKNPVITNDVFESLKEKFPDIKYFNEEHGVKIPAAWLIEQCGLKGKRLGPVGVYDKQALIIVNYDGAKQRDVLKLVKIIKNEVRNKFNINLETEVNIL